MRVRVEGGGAEERERGLVAAVEAGATGAEELAGPPPALVLYAPSELAVSVRQAVVGVSSRLRVGMPEAVPERAWSEAWKEGLEPVVVSERLAVRPSFRSFDPGPGQRVVVVDPGQAFGTGAHGSTRLALELLSGLPEEQLAHARVLDVGCGTGVLALAALALGARGALAVDLDPLATEATLENARRNGLAGGLEVFRGPLAEAPTGRWSLILANLIRSELLPLLPEIAARCPAGGRLILSGLLVAEEPEMLRLLEGMGFVVEDRREENDPRGDAWLALRARLEGSQGGAGEG